jgi:phosphoribosyl 1,2-cyclic phosphodiesterase
MGSQIEVIFWGTRGLISSPRAETIKYGGNTMCIQLVFGNFKILIDTGFGVSNYGESLMPELLSGSSQNFSIFYTHFHWDHIQGLPFFHPIYFPSTSLNIYSPWTTTKLLEKLDVLFDGSYSPFSGIRSMPSNINFHQIQSHVQFGELEIKPIALNHIHNPLADKSEPSCVGYVFKTKQKKIIVATDHEACPSAANDLLIEEAKNADLLIHNGQFSEEEYKAHMGFGHSSFDQALQNAEKSCVQRTLITHHHPQRNDDELDHITKELQKKYPKLNFAFSQEGDVYKV